MAMGSKFEELLVDLAGQVKGIERLLQADARRQDELSRDLGLLREKVAKLEKGEEWSGEERRKVDQRLGTGDHTFERLKYEVKQAEKASESALAEARGALATSKAVLKNVEEVRKLIQKRDDRSSSRRWFVVKKIIEHAVPLIVSGVGTFLALHFQLFKGTPK
jgi:hypothetical protein